MKRPVSLLLSMVLLLSLAGCAYVAAKAQEGESYSVYYEEKDLGGAGGGDAVRAESVSLPGAEDMTTQQLAEALLSRLLSGPSDDGLKSPVPANTQLLSCSLRDTHALVDLSGSYGTLSGVGLTMADYCIALTLTQLKEIHTVSVTVRGQELAYRDTQNFSPRDVLFSSTEDVVGEVKATLYFLDGTGKLTPEERTLELYEGDTQAETLLAALAEGPQTAGLTSALPDGLQLKSVRVEEGICYINLPSSALPNLPGSEQLRTALNAAAESLCSLKTVDSVQFLVDGEPAELYGGVPVWDPYPAK